MNREKPAKAGQDKENISPKEEGRNATGVEGKL